MPRSSLVRQARRLAVVLAVLGCCTVLSHGDVLVLDDGTQRDGKVFKEEAGVLSVRTLKGVEKIPAEKVKSRTPGESAPEKYDRLKAAISGDVVTAAGLWDLYEFQKEHAADLPPETAKENQRLLPRILKKDPEHAGAHGEMGEVSFDGRWVKAADVPRLQAEKAREKVRLEWQLRLGVPVKMAQTDHFLLLDNTGEKDLEARAATLEKAHEVLLQATGLKQLWKDRCNIVTIKSYEAYCKVLDDFAAEANIGASIVTAAKDRSTGGLWRQKPYPFELRWPSSGSEGMWSAITHNVGHLAVWTMWAQGGRPWEKEAPPAWIDEGLSAWLEINVMGQQMNSCMGESRKHSEQPVGGTTDKQPKKKKDPKKNAEDLAAAKNEYKERCKAAVENDEFPKLREFLKYFVGDFGPPEEGGAIGLVTWLMQLDGEKFKKLVALYVKAGKKRDDEYWAEAYGFETIEQMETKWRGWVLGEW